MEETQAVMFCMWVSQLGKLKCLFRSVFFLSFFVLVFATTFIICRHIFILNFYLTYLLMLLCSKGLKEHIWQTSENSDRNLFVIYFVIRRYLLVYDVANINVAENRKSKASVFIACDQFRIWPPGAIPHHWNLRIRLWQATYKHSRIRKRRPYEIQDTVLKHLLPYRRCFLGGGGLSIRRKDYWWLVQVIHPDGL